MSRRHLTYAALVVASFVLAACSQPLAPVSEDTATCNMYWTGSGFVCEPE
jgi:hypothetical protein